MSSEPLRPKRVCVVGAGAAGLATAWSLGRHPDKFEVHVYEKDAWAGGVSTSEDIGQGHWVNDGVQGASDSYRNTILFHKEFGFEHHPVHLKVAFGKGETAWNNIAPTALIHQHKDEIKRFGEVLRRISRREWFYAFVRIRTVLRWNNFSKSFRDHLVFPLTALFFGTGNQTPEVSSVVIARVFLDPDVRLFTYDEAYLLHETPNFLAFDDLGKLYGTVAKGVGAQVHLSRPVTKVERRQNKVYVTDDTDSIDEFDEIVFTSNAQLPLQVLSSTRWWERRVLGSVTYYNDISVTHEDEAYMRRHYEFDNDRGDMYFVRTDPEDSEVLEMSFNLSNYQKQLQGTGRNVYQSIFLNDQIKDRWTWNEIDEDKILVRKWWRQMSHTWKHFAYVVPWVRFIQGRKNTWYAGAWTLFNTHELAIISGLAVAERLGAPYPFDHDELAAKQFDNLMKISHGIDRHKEGCCPRRRPASSDRKED
eukprot:m.3145 g.3145  ORF g.3145 m.3145 type:complete len:476 (-) comp4584_c0_seq1:3-1430(-)